tara:strand:- start:777 stop:1379 length:603 start_codon:yes stop_codon:yes gene_type:complete
MLAFLGWNPGTTQEIFSMDELIESFSLERVGKAGAKFDFDKTKWFNQQYLRAKDGQELSDLVSPLFQEKVSDADLAVICELMKERATFAKDIFNESTFFFEAPLEYDEKTLRKKWKESTPDILNQLIEILDSISSFDPLTIETTFKSFLEEKELGFGAVLPNFRLAITGLGMGPSMFHICSILGKEEVIKRLRLAIERNA